jgi:3-deoxy-D-manno-octulosonate 8-phosphate phosphatase (KDO 8-P phosphatase)
MIKLIVIDVDGTLTDGGIIYGTASADMATALVELKQFNAADGLGIVMALAAGLKVAIVSGRDSQAVRRRMSELGVTDVIQSAGDKGAKIRELQAKHGVTKDETAFIGDDINDLPAFDECGLCVAVEDAVDIVLNRADFVTARGGGHGAVREAIDTILKRQGMYNEAVENYLEKVKTKPAPAN